MIENKNLHQKIIIIGSGLSGLACAAVLDQQGFQVSIYEEKSQIGGRVSSQVIENQYILDEGFQVLLTSYPELKNFINLDELKLYYFNSGAQIYTPEKVIKLGNPFLNFESILTEVFSKDFYFTDKLRVLKIIFKAFVASKNQSELNHISTIDYLYFQGFSLKFINLFWRPFLKGVLLDDTLSVPASYFQFLIKSFLLGKAALPQKGMNQLAQQMHSKLKHSKTYLNHKITEIKSSYIVDSFSEKIDANYIVCAFDPNTNEKIYNKTINYYFTVSEKLNIGKWLYLVPPEYGFSINSVCQLTEVAPNYSQNKKTLLSVSVVGESVSNPQKIQNELEKLFGSNPDFQYVKHFSINKALPKKCDWWAGFKVENGIYYCGDYLESPSINGALKSGRLVAESIIKNANKT